jgi:hypothetical protein
MVRRRQLGGLAMWVALVGLTAASMSCTDRGRDVRGQGRFIRITSEGFYDEPFYMVEDRISAFVLEPGTDDFTGLLGIGGYGAFLVPEVPEGRYYLVRETSRGFTSIYVTETSSPDISEVAYGRGNGFVPTTTTTLTLAVTGLTPWTADDDLQLVSPNLGLVVADLDARAATGALALGATALEGLVVDFREEALPLPDAASKDELLVTQLARSTTPEGLTYRAVSRALDVGLFTMTSSVNTDLSGALEPVPQDRSLVLDVSSAAFEPFVADVSPLASGEGLVIAVTGLPRAASLGAYDRGPELAVLTSSSAIEGPVTLSWGHPFASLDEYVIADFVAGVDYLPTDLGTGVRVAATMRTIASIDELRASPTIAPRISPVRGATINGRSLFEAQSGVGYRPTLAWQPPALGTPTAYAVRFSRLSNDDASDPETESRAVAVILTRDTEVVVPPIVFEAGNTYYARIIAFDEPSRNLDKAPYRYQLPSASAEVLSAPFTP